MTTDDPPGDPDEPRQSPDDQAEHRAAVDAATERVLRRWHDLFERLRHT